MAHVASLGVVVLFEDEIRAAAKALYELHDFYESGKEDDTQKFALINNALQSSFAALCNRELASTDTNHVTIASKRLFKLVK